MTNVMYVNHNTAEVYNTFDHARKAYYEMNPIDVYIWNDVIGKWGLYTTKNLVK